MERKAPGDAGVKPVKRKRSSRTVPADKLGSSVGIQEVEHGGWHRVPTVKTRVPMSTPEEQMATAVQQSNVRLQGTMAKILQAERNDLAEQVQKCRVDHLTETAGSCRHKSDRSPGKFDEEPMKYAELVGSN